MRKYIASVSFGKDSLAMLFWLIDNKKPIDEVVFYDTGMEFQAIYDTRDSILPILSRLGIKYTELKPEHPFEWTMFERPVNGKNGFHYGYSWCGGRCRWGTTAKLKAINQYCRDNYQYVGIAADEPKRIEKALKQGKILPLVNIGMTEKDCLELCYKQGFFWEENGVQLYDILDRVSCWCCANKNLKELRNYHKYLPEYWHKLELLQSKTGRSFKKDNSIFNLSARFNKEQENETSKN